MKYSFLILLFFTVQIALSQDDLLSEIDSTAVVSQPVTSAFKAMKIVNLESTKIASKGDFYLVVAHRFATIKNGIDDFFGLDNAVTQIKFIYGVAEGLSFSLGRSEQAYDLGGKYLLKNQMENGFPVTIVGFNSVAFNNLLKESIYPKLKFEDRIIFTNQILISRKFSDKFTFQLAPTFFHENFATIENQDNSQFAIGAGGRYKMTKRLSLNMDYAAHLNRASGSIYRNPLSVGLDIESGGHVFQLHFTNSQGIHEAAFLGNSTGDWTKGEINFGFNLVRVF